MCNIGSNGMEQYIMIVNSLREKLILCQRNKFNMKEFKANKTANISKGKLYEANDINAPSHKDRHDWIPKNKYSK